MNIDEEKPRSPLSRVRIDGDKVRSIRESKGLTQLYVATVLGVTTDTVSRWENRRYPTVKWENAEKLAQALEVSVDEILELHEGDQKKKGRGEATISALPAALPKRKGLFILVVAIILVSGLYFVNLRQDHYVEIKATRYLPSHTPAGQPFPVVVRVESVKGQPFSFILEELLPEGCIVVKGSPKIVSRSQDGKMLKWVGNSRKNPFFLSYLVHTAREAKMADRLVFEGMITLDQSPGKRQKVQGDGSIEILDYHWADSNGDGRIDDEEILTIYGAFDALHDLGVELELIEEIWSGKGYKWDAAAKRYSVIR